jgi:pimeloyl-ACP methyl ester carboxylesterase
MSKATPNPVESTYGSPPTKSGGSTAHSIPHPEPVSSCTHHIAGILVTVFGLDELPSNVTDVSVLWLLHPRLQTQASMAPFAAHLIAEWNKQQKPSTGKKRKGLIAVSFDQRNHGSRLVSAIANEAWRSGNEHHASDMFSCYTGTAQDTSLLLDFLPGYIFPEPSDARRIVQNLVLGISLGGHAAWHVLMHDARFSAAVVTIGCPDYTRLMTDRARLSKRKTWTSSSPPGRDFLGSADFPPSLIEAVKKSDPAGLIWSLPGLQWRKDQEHLHTSLTEEERQALLPVMTRCFGNKRILNLSGGADKLVPYAHSKPFIDWLKTVSGKGGWFEGSGLVLEDMVFDGVGHEVPSRMVDEMVRFVKQSLEDERVSGMDAAPGGGAGRLGSKI